MNTPALRIEQGPALAAQETAETVKNDADMGKVLKLVQSTNATLTPKEVSDHVARLMNVYDDLTARFEKNRKRIETELAELRQNGGAVSAQLHQLDAGLRGHNMSLQALTASTGANVERLTTSLSGLGKLLDVQDKIIGEQSSRLDQFDAALELVDAATRGNRARIDMLREDIDKKHTVVQAQIRGLEAVQQDHYAELTQVQQLVNVLQAEAERLDIAIAAVSGRLDGHVNLTRRRFKLAAGTAAALLVLTVSGFALVKWAPAFAPDSLAAALTQAGQRIDAVEQKIAGLPALESRADEQDAKINQLSAKVASLQRGLTGISRSLNLSAGSPRLHDPVWLRQQGANRYTIHLLGAATEAEMAGFLAQNAAQFKDLTLAYAVMHRDNLERHNLFLGVYDSQEEAKRALAALPPELKAQKPWVRSLRSVQGALK